MMRHICMLSFNFERAIPWIWVHFEEIENNYVCTQAYYQWVIFIPIQRDLGIFNHFVQLFSTQFRQCLSLTLDPRGLGQHYDYKDMLQNQVRKLHFALLYPNLAVVISHSRNRVRKDEWSNFNVYSPSTYFLMEYWNAFISPTSP